MWVSKILKKVSKGCRFCFFWTPWKLYFNQLWIWKIQKKTITKPFYTYINIQHSSLLKNSQTSDYCISISVLKACALWRLNVARLSFTVIIDERDLSVFFSWLYISGKFFSKEPCVIYNIEPLWYWDTNLYPCYYLLVIVL